MAVEVPNSLNWLSFITGILSFGLTILNLIALYANFVATIRSAPSEIRDTLGNLRQQLCEEREALRHQTREIRTKSKLRQHIIHMSDKVAGDEARKALAYAEQTLPLHYLTLRDLWRNFKELERPFLVASGHRAEAIHNGAAWGETDLDEKVRADFERHGESGSFADWSALYKCDFAHRFIWWQVKEDVIKLSNEVMRIMARRTEREVTYIRMMVKQIFQGDGPPHVVDVRPRRSPGGGGGGARRRMSWGSRPVRSPVPHRNSPASTRRITEPHKKPKEESSFSAESSGENSMTTRRGASTTIQRDSSPVLSEHNNSYPKSDAATIGRHRHHYQHHRHHSRNRWEHFRAQPDRHYDIREYFERQRGRGHSRIVEVIPGSEIDHYKSRPWHGDGTK